MLPFKMNYVRNLCVSGRKVCSGSLPADGSSVWSPLWQALPSPHTWNLGRVWVSVKGHVQPRNQASSPNLSATHQWPRLTLSSPSLCRECKWKYKWPRVQGESHVVSWLNPVFPSCVEDCCLILGCRNCRELIRTVFWNLGFVVCVGGVRDVLWCTPRVYDEDTLSPWLPRATSG